MRQTRTFVVRILADDDDPTRLRGQVSEPGGDDEWRVRFANAGEFLNVLRQRLSLDLSPATVSADNAEPSANS